MRKKQDAVVVTSIAIRPAQKVRLDAVARLVRSSRSALVRRALDTLLAGYEARLIGDGGRDGEVEERADAVAS